MSLSERPDQFSIHQMLGGAPPAPGAPGAAPVYPQQQTFISDLAPQRNRQVLLENELAEKASESEQTSPQRIFTILQRHLFLILFLTFIIPVCVFLVDTYVRKKSYLVEFRADARLLEEDSGFTFGFSKISAPAVDILNLNAVLNTREFDQVVLRRIALGARVAKGMTPAGESSTPDAVDSSRPAETSQTEALLLSLALQSEESGQVPSEYTRLRGRQGFQPLEDGRVVLSLTGPFQEFMDRVILQMVPAINEVLADRQRQATEDFRLKIEGLLMVMSRENERIDSELVQLAAEVTEEDEPLAKTFSRLNELKQDEHRLRMQLLKGELQLTFLKQSMPDQKIASQFGIRSSSEIRLALAERVPLRKTWAQLVSQYEEMLARYTPEHPKVKSIQDEIESVKERLRAGGHVTAEGILPPLPTVEEAASLTAILLLSEQLELLKMELNEVVAQVAAQQAQQQSGLSNKMSPAESQRINELLRRRRALIKESSALEADQIKLHQALYHTRLRSTDLSKIDAYTPVGSPSSRLITPLVAVDVSLALVLGLVMGCAVAFLLESMDRYLHTSFDIYQRLHLPCLGIIPAIKSKEEVQISVENPGSRMAEIFAHLRNNIRYSVVKDPQRCLLIASALQHEGKSTVAMNLSVSYAMEENSVLLIDADLRRGRHGNNEIVDMGVDLEEHGLSDYLIGEATFRDVIKATNIPGLSVMPSGRRIHNPARFVGSERMRFLLEEAKINYDIVIVDSPAILPVVDTTTYSNLVSGVLLVVAAEEVNVERVRSALHRLYHVNSPVIGAVLNKARTNQCATYYGSYTSGAPYYYTD